MSKYFFVFYRRMLSPDHAFWSSGKSACAMHPTCSNYMEQAIEKYGYARGVSKGLRRILRCHPWQKNLIDLP